jgi:hypothetical protein
VINVHRLKIGLTFKFTMVFIQARYSILDDCQVLVVNAYVPPEYTRYSSVDIVDEC